MTLTDSEQNKSVAVRPPMQSESAAAEDEIKTLGCFLLTDPASVKHCINI